MAMYVIMGYTRGDDLIHSKGTPLFASPDRQTCEVNMAALQRETDEWLVAGGLSTVAHYNHCGVISRYEIVKTRY